MFIEFCTALNESTDYQGGQKFHLEKTFLSSMELPVSRFPENPRKPRKVSKPKQDFGVLFGRSGAKPKTLNSPWFPGHPRMLKKGRRTYLDFCCIKAISSTVRLFFKALCGLAKKKLAIHEKILPPSC